MKFQAHIINVRKLNESCTKENDVIRPCILIKDCIKKHNFGFLHCWPIVKDHPTFFDMDKTSTPKVGKKIQT